MYPVRAAAASGRLQYPVGNGNSYVPPAAAWAGLVVIGDGSAVPVSGGSSATTGRQSTPLLLAFFSVIAGMATLTRARMAAALVYEVAWNRMLAGTLGSSSYTLAVVLCAYMAGLALGSRVFGARADQSSSPLRLYGWLEVGISLWVLAVPWLLVAVGWINRWLYPAFSGHIVWLLGLRCLLSFVVLLVPTTLMAGVGPGCEYMRVLAHLPALLLPSAQRAAIIGFGSGTSAATLALYPLDSIDIIEITRDVTDAAPYFLDANRGILGRSAGRP